MTIRFPYSRQSITAADEAAVVTALHQPHLTQGPEVTAFEAELTAFFHTRETIVCSNGTTALHLAYMAAGLGPEKGLITSPVTFLATGNAARMEGAPVFFADVDPATGNLDPASVAHLLKTSPVRIGAVTVVHLAGRAGPMAELRALTEAYGCLLIEDACHAAGAWYEGGDGKRHAAGSCDLSDIACHSFHAIKHIACGEGGAVTTRHPEMAAHMRRLRSHGMERDRALMAAPPPEPAPWYYEMDEMGWNYRLPDLLCALGRSQLRRVEEGLVKRRRIAALYDELLGNQRYLTLPAPRDFPEQHAWHLYSVLIDFEGLGHSRGEIMKALAEKGVGTQVHYIPLTQQPYYQRLGAKPLPGSESYYARTLSIPMYPDLTDDDVAEVATIVKGVLAS